VVPKWHPSAHAERAFCVRLFNQSLSLQTQLCRQQTCANNKFDGIDATRSDVKVTFVSRMQGDTVEMSDPIARSALRLCIPATKKHSPTEKAISTFARSCGCQQVRMRLCYGFGYPGSETYAWRACILFIPCYMSLPAVDECVPAWSICRVRVTQCDCCLHRTGCGLHRNAYSLTHSSSTHSRMRWWSIEHASRCLIGVHGIRAD
jgi:hypothetical protein